MVQTIEYHKSKVQPIDYYHKSMVQPIDYYKSKFLPAENAYFNVYVKFMDSIKLYSMMLNYYCLFLVCTPFWELYIFYTKLWASYYANLNVQYPQFI
jgi:hypothetical protein